ncbi:MAG: AMMECR1 domain-containing protein, partial [Bryobacteraceae bacterium]
MFPPLSNGERRALLRIARHAILESTVRQTTWQPEIPEGPLAELRGAFVTLHLRGKLRGCVGQLHSAAPLARVVAHCAQMASSEDTRFAPVAEREIADLSIEISALSDLEALRPEDVEIGRHG